MPFRDLTRKCDCCHKTIQYSDKEAGRCTQDRCFWKYDYCGDCIRVIRYSHTNIACETICKNCDQK